MTRARARSITSRSFSALLLGSFVAYLAACTAAQQARVVADGQLFCAKASTDGPLIVALADTGGAPVVVTGLASSVVAADCALINAIPVTPPPLPAAAPVVAVAVMKGVS